MIDVHGQLQVADSVDDDRNGESRKLFQQFVRRLIQLTRESSFEYGFENELDEFLRACLAQDAATTREWLNQTFFEHFDDTAVAVGLLRAVAHLDYDEVQPQGPAMALAALSHKDVEVRECAIRAFENWGRPETLTLLESIQCQEPWLQDYVTRVVADLRKELAHVASGAED